MAKAKKKASDQQTCYVGVRFTPAEWAAIIKRADGAPVASTIRAIVAKVLRFDVG